MSRITPVMAALKSQGRKALIPYLMAGFPHPDHTLALMQALVEGGADIIELGVPFSDPMADGPVIQEAGEEALRHHVGMTEVLAMVRQFRATDTHTPVVLMGYANPVESYNLVHGEHGFVKDAATAGVDGVLVVDYPPEECVDFAAALKAHQMDLFFLPPPAPTSACSKWLRWPAAMCITCHSRASPARAHSTPTRWKPCCRAFGSMCTFPWVWALASATPPPPKPLAK